MRNLQEFTTESLIRLGRDLIEPDATDRNPEYERGITELIMDASGRSREEITLALGISRREETMNISVTKDQVSYLDDLLADEWRRLDAERRECPDPEERDEILARQHEIEDIQHAVAGRALLRATPEAPTPMPPAVFQVGERAHRVSPITNDITSTGTIHDIKWGDATGDWLYRLRREGGQVEACYYPARCFRRVES